MDKSLEIMMRDYRKGDGEFTFILFTIAICSYIILVAVLFNFYGA